MEGNNGRDREATERRHTIGMATVLLAQLSRPPLTAPMRFARLAQVPKAPTDALRTLEHTSTTMVAAIMAEQAASGGLGGPVTLSLSPTLKPTINLPSRNVTLSELQRLKRQFVTIHKKAITLGTTEKGAVDWSEDSIADKFALYIEGNLKP